MWRKLHKVLRKLQLNYSVKIQANWYPSKVNTAADETSRLTCGEAMEDFWMGGQATDVVRHQELEALIYILSRSDEQLGNTVTSSGKRSRWRIEEEVKGEGNPEDAEGRERKKARKGPKGRRK